jgi:hypothetical protein
LIHTTNKERKAVERARELWLVDTDDAAGQLLRDSRGQLYVTWRRYSGGKKRPVMVIKAPKDWGLKPDHTVRDSMTRGGLEEWTNKK